CSCVDQSNTRGTVRDRPNFKVEEDVATLRKAMEGLGTTEKSLIEVLTKSSNAQRQLIARAYEKTTGRKLIDDLEGDTHGDFEDLLVALVKDPAVHDCHEVIKAIKGAGTTESTLTEIFASRSNRQIKTLAPMQVWACFTAHVLDVRCSFLSVGAHVNFKMFCGELFAVCINLPCHHSTQTLYEAGEKKWGTDEAKFIDILCHRSVPQLRQTLIEYKNISKKTLQESIESEMSGDLEELLVAVVKCVKSVPAYMAERLFKSMKGAGTTESTLTRIIVSRSEIDLLDVRAEYKKLFGYTLYSQLESEVSGNYGEALKTLCGQDD
uniref:Annexin n=1 Tax=Salarias fasciatus TaxID=181472 RepID=A0A672IZY5_SALFA